MPTHSSTYINIARVVKHGLVLIDASISTVTLYITYTHTYLILYLHTRAWHQPRHHMVLTEWVEAIVNSLGTHYFIV